MTETRQVLADAFAKLQPDIDRADWLGFSTRFHRFLDAEAWNDAAMMLVPEGWVIHSIQETPEVVKEEHTGWEPLPDWTATLLRQDCAGYRNRKKFNEAFANGDGDSSALAIVQAALRASAALEEPKP